ncbi:MAG: amylo-alpha-1,6-glucosidase, partial [Limisphaerales bacterium]
MDKPVMTPAPGERVLRFVGDSVQFHLRAPDAAMFPGGKALLRTNLGKAGRLRKEIIETYSGKRPLSVAFWRDIPMRRQPDGSWSLELPITEPGYFKAKAFFVDTFGRQIWPDGPDAGLCCHPNIYRTGNTIYCAFTRMFGGTKNARSTRDASLEKKMRELDERGFTVIPASGTFRDLKRELPHIMGTLGCKVLHLLPVNPTPTTFARFGRFGSPYACQDLVAIDPALVEFDKRTNGVEQFCELAYDVHARGGRVILDVVINHTGWGSTLYEHHPEWFLREHDGKFASPGAWGTVWEDLVELNPHFTELWEHFAEAFLTWCRRGVDGFRCDAGYKVPLPVWQYIEARVRQEFPDTLFLLEGLGGSWEATETLLTSGGMQWAYSELFQNYSGGEVQWYLDYALRQSDSVGVYVHYSETHDNDRLAKKGKQWSLLRNRLCALTSVTGGFGFTCGVEWLADEKIEVHQSRGLNWGAEENIIPELAALNHLLSNHPCFFDGAKLTRLSANAAPVFALQRVSAEGKDRVLVLVNTDLHNEHTFSVSEKIFKEIGEPLIDLLGQPNPSPLRVDSRVVLTVPPGGAYCLASTPQAIGVAGPDYRRAKAQASWAVSALSKMLMPEEIGTLPWLELAKLVEANPAQFLANVSNLRSRGGANAISGMEPSGALLSLLSSPSEFPRVIRWELIDRRRITPVPPEHWLLLHDKTPFRATLKLAGEKREEHVESIAVHDGYVAFFAPAGLSKDRTISGDATIVLERYSSELREVTATVRFLAPEPEFSKTLTTNEQVSDEALVLLTNGIGGMARLCVDLGRIKSKYDCALGANLHSTLPVDRHVFAKR